MYNQPMYWLLDGQGNPYPSNDSAAANELIINAAKRHVAIADKQVHGHEIYISTVFLVLDHNFDPEGPPVLFESKVFIDNNPVDTSMRRYSTREEAQVGHDEIVMQVDELLAKMSETDVVKIGAMLKMLTE